MNSLRDLSEMSREYGLGSRYFVVVLAILGALMAVLAVWGNAGVETDAPAPVMPAASPSSPAASY